MHGRDFGGGARAPHGVFSIWDQSVFALQALQLHPVALFAAVDAHQRAVVCGALHVFDTHVAQNFCIHEFESF